MAGSSGGQILRWKSEGLSEADAHRPVVPTSPAMKMAGLISHMRWVERTWLEVLFLGGDETQNPSFGETDEDANWCTGGVALKQLLVDYEAQCARSNEIISSIRHIWTGARVGSRQHREPGRGGTENSYRPFCVLTGILPHWNGEPVRIRWTGGRRRDDAGRGSGSARLRRGQTHGAVPHLLLGSGEGGGPPSR
ncbi:DUF664 domain-containing protein [Streptomyces sp. NPDC087437]|uniref:mycothiol transferase n=1 Tax=Streptomyces sp. NPDC087437 TaxID=3365789 RepID=UPI00382662AD